LTSELASKSVCYKLAIRAQKVVNFKSLNFASSQLEIDLRNDVRVSFKSIQVRVARFF
jgi:hypothetical protein